jgi:isopenicillin N synthase-like dioxygenase
MERVPELSLKAYTSGTGDEKRRFIDELFVGLKRYGFVVLKDHPIEVSLLHKAYDASRKFFELDESTKLKYADKNGAGQRGLTVFGKEHAKDAKVPDLKEFWHVGRELPESHRLKSFFPNNVWPAEIPEFKPIFQSLFQSLDDTGRIMLEALTGPLEIDKNYFTRMTGLGSSILRLLHYPPIPANADPRSIRAAAHEDINLITLLVSASSSGLQLLNRNGEWLSVDADPENIIVDSGDMLARITNDVIPATTHRVVNPEGPNLPRYSMPYFMHPNPDALLSCLPSCHGEEAKYSDIVANDFLFQRLRDIGLTK